MARIAKASQAGTDINALVAQAVAQVLAAQTGAVVAPKPKAKAALPAYAKCERGEIVDAKGNSTPCLVFTDANGRETRMGARKISAVMAFTSECAAFLKSAQ